jgi:hypothetical protein
MTHVRNGLGLGCIIYAGGDVPSIYRRLDELQPVWCPEPLFTGYFFALFALYLTMLVLFVRGRRPLSTAAGLYLCITQFTAWGVAATGTLSVTPMLIGPLLLTWTICHAGGRLRGLSVKRCESMSIDAMCGVFAAMMALAAISKFSASGFDWANGQTHAMLVFERQLHAPAPLQWLRSLLSQSPAACTLSAASVWLIEALAPLFLWKRFRRIYAWLVVQMFIGLALFLGVVEVAWMVMPLALAYSSRE